MSEARTESVAPVPPRPRPATPSAAVLAAAVLVAVTLAATAAAWLRGRLKVQDYDDEGYFVFSVNRFLSGGRLHDDLPTLYGPSYYLLYGAAARLAGSPDGRMTHDLARWLTPALFGLGALAAAGAVLRMTGRASAAVFAVAAMFLIGPVAHGQPGHPAAMAVAAAGLALAAVAVLPPIPAAAAAGAAAALALTVKVNIGVFLSAAVGWWALILTPLPPPWGRLRPAGAVLLSATPAAVMAHRLAEPGYGLYAAFCGAALLSVLWRSASLAPSLSAEVRPVALWASLAAGFAAALALSLGGMFATGTTADGLRRAWETLRDQAAHLPWATPAPIGTAHLAAAVLGAVAAAVLPERLRPGAVVASVVAAIIGALACPRPFGGAAFETVWAVPLLWAVIRPPRPGEPPRDAAARAALAAVAVFHLPVGYPIAFGQWDHALLFVLPALAVALSDLATATATDRTDSAETEATPPIRRVPVWVLRIVAAGLVATMAWDAVGDLRELRRPERVRPLFLDGLTTARPTERDAAVREWLVLNLRTNAGTVLGLPELFSLDEWSGLPAATRADWHPWAAVFGPERQGRMLAEFRAADRPCVVRNRRLASFWTFGRPLPPGPMVRHIERETAVAAWVADGDAGDPASRYELLLPRSRTEPVRIVGAEWLADPATGAVLGVRVTAPVLPGVRIAGVRIADLSSVGAPAADIPASAAGLPAGGLSLDEPWTLTFPLPLRPGATGKRFFVVRLLDAEGRVAVRLPFFSSGE